MKNSLSKDARILLAIGMLFLAGLMIASTFVNVYLIRLTNNMGLIILQNIANYTALLSAFALGTRFTKKGNMLTLLRVGLVAEILYYFLILVLKEKAGDFLIALGAFNGFGMGFYYFTFNILVGKMLDETNRSKFFSFQSSFSYIFGVLAPTISGFIIVKFSELSGYYVLFTSSVAVFVLAIIFSFQLKQVHSDEDYHIMGVLKLKNNPYWDANKYINFSFGLREALYTQIFTVFAYLIISNEQTIGNLNSMMSLIGVVSSLFIASKFNIQSQKKYYLLYSILYITSLAGLGLFATTWSLYLSYMLNGLVICWGSVIYQGLKYQLSNRAKNGFNDSDYIITAEVPMAAGRLSGLILFFLFNINYGGFDLYRCLLIAIPFMTLLDYVVIEKKIHWLKND